jgi:hypothetical protein
MARAGATVKEICDDHAEVFIKYSTGISRFINVYAPRRDFKTEVFWFYGPTGSGKSYTAQRRGGADAYHKMGGNKWWDGYDNHSDVVINDYRTNLCPFNELLRLLDMYPHRVEGKGVSMEFVARRVYITCPKDPRDVWTGEDGKEREDIEQLLRRVEHVVEFTQRLWQPTDEQPEPPQRDIGSGLDCPVHDAGEPAAIAPLFNIFRV